MYIVVPSPPSLVRRVSVQGEIRYLFPTRPAPMKYNLALKELRNAGPTLRPLTSALLDPRFGRDEWK